MLTPAYTGEPAASLAIATAPNGTLPRRRLAPRLIDFALFSVAAWLNLFAYSSVEPILIGLMFYTAGMGLLLGPKLGGTQERRIFTRVFAVSFTMAGVAAVYANYLTDPNAMLSDAASFFEIASGRASGLTLDDLSVMHEGPLAILLWRAAYDFFAAVGFSREPYVGISVNVTAVALTSVVALKMARRVYGEDLYRFKRLGLLFSACGTFWLFAAIHVRDAVVLLALSALAHAWLVFLARPDVGMRLLQITGASLLAALFFGLLRRELLYVPMAMAVAAVAALIFGRNVGRGRPVVYVLALAGLTVAAGLLITFGETILLVLASGQEGYYELAADQHASTSLGMALIVERPLPIRIVLGSVYLLVFPIPFWSGFQLESAYHLFKSFHVIFMYFLIPLLVVAIGQLLRHKPHRTPAFLFLLAISLGFTMAVAGTSMETRHLGAFLTPLLILALYPDLRLPSARKGYSLLLTVTFAGVVVVHTFWVILKLT